jgi:hypothetical protein
MRDQEGDDDKETVVGRFWKEDELGSFWGNLAWVTLESGVHFKSCASLLLSKVSWDSCEDLNHTRLVTPILDSDWSYTYSALYCTYSLSYTYTNSDLGVEFCFESPIRVVGSIW